MNETTEELRKLLVIFGDALAEREGYKVHKGMDAVRYYLVRTFHWQLSELPKDLKDICFLLREEMLAVSQEDPEKES